MLLTPDQCAARIGCTRQNIYRLIKANILGCERFSRSVMVPEKCLQDLLAKGPRRAGRPKSK